MRFRTGRVKFGTCRVQSLTSRPELWTDRVVAHIAVAVLDLPGDFLRVGGGDYRGWVIIDWQVAVGWQVGIPDLGVQLQQFGIPGLSGTTLWSTCPLPWSLVWAAAPCGPAARPQRAQWLGRPVEQGFDLWAP